MLPARWFCAPAVLLFVAGVSRSGNAGQNPVSPATSPPAFTAVFRNSEGAWLLHSAGEALSIQRERSLPRKQLTFRALDGRPFKWLSPPLDFGYWRDEWLVVDGSPVLFRFDRSGRFLRATPIPARATSIATGNGGVWVHDALLGGGIQRLWHSVDSLRFRRLPADIGLAARTKLHELLSSQVVLESRDEVSCYLANAMGPPVLRTVGIAGRVREHSLAYVRSVGRAMSEEFSGDDFPIDEYSAPVADLMRRSEGGVVVLRNREDLPCREGRRATMLRRRVDRYDSSGSIVQTAGFDTAVRFILREDPSGVTVWTDSGEVRYGRFGEPVTGRVIAMCGP